MTQILSFKNVSKEYDGEIVLKGVSFNIREGEFITILGPSGSGKSTVLRLIAGFEQPSSGQIIFNNQDLTKIPAYKREINTIFQHLGLFPHLNVYENIAYGLRIKKKSNLEIEEKIKAVLELVVLKNCEKKFISELSGGEKQRVAIARVLINDSKIVLFDEPFSALDLKLRRKMQTELKKIKNKVTGTTFIFITHDQEEGLMLGDRTIILNEGQVQQISKPEAVYNDPENK
jgi:spermidine/putrescine transport system ATP-binding protein